MFPWSFIFFRNSLFHCTHHISMSFSSWAFHLHFICISYFTHVCSWLNTNTSCTHSLLIFFYFSTLLWTNPTNHVPWSYVDIMFQELLHPHHDGIMFTLYHYTFMHYLPMHHFFCFIMDILLLPIYIVSFIDT